MGFAPNREVEAEVAVVPLPNIEGVLVLEVPVFPNTLFRPEDKDSVPNGELVAEVAVVPPPKIADVVVPADA